MAIDLKMLNAALDNAYLKRFGKNDERQTAYFESETDAYISKMGKYADNVRRVGIEIDRVVKSVEYYNVRITDVIDAKTGVNRGNNWKKASFYEKHPPIILGMKFFFAGSVWLAINMNEIEGEGDSAVLHKCTNVLSWSDGKGEVIVEPCVIAKDIIVNNANVNKPDFSYAHGDKICYVQHNEYTMTFRNDKRFIIGHAPWTVRGLDLTQRQFTMDAGSVNLLSFTIAADQERPGDDLVNDIPAGPEHGGGEPIDPADYHIVVSPEITELYQYDVVSIAAYLHDGDMRLDNPVTFDFSGADSQCYEISGLTANGFTIKCFAAYTMNPLVVTCAAVVDGKSTIRTLNIWLKDTF